LRRRLMVDADWYCVPGQPVMIRRSGQEKLAGWLQQAKNGAATQQSSGNGDGRDHGALSDAFGLVTKRPAFETLEVTHRCLNSKILLAKRSDGIEVRCQVRNNANFRVGMRLSPCRKDGPTLYTYQGRLPRRRGKF
jgi:hypothetical protein